MPKPELIRPRWRSGGAFAEVLPTPNVSAEIQKSLVGNKHEKLPRKTDGPIEGELADYLPSLLSDLRLHDLGDQVYWWMMLGLSVLFLVFELIFVTLAARTSQIVVFQNSIVFCLVILLAFLAIYGAASAYLHMGTELPRWLRRVPSGWFHAMPVIWMGGFTVGLNFYVVTVTGYSNSPFLHALLASSVVVLSLPRENSLLVVGLAVVTTVMGGRGAWVTAPASAEVISAWGGHALASKIVLVTFIYSAVSVVVLRSIANHKLGPKS